MALPQDGQNANGLTKVTQIPAGKELMFIDPTTNEGGIITLEDLTKQILNGLTSQTFGLDSGTQTLPAAINYLYGNRVPWCKITHPNDNDALAKLNTPALLFGTGTDRPYTIIFEDSRGDSALGGGISVVYGFMYAMDAYGTQIAQHYSGVIRKRKKENNTWSDWSIIHD